MNSTTTPKTNTNSIAVFVLRLGALLLMIAGFHQHMDYYSGLYETSISNREVGLKSSIVSSSPPDADANDKFFESLLARFNSTVLHYWDTEILKSLPLTLPQIQDVAARTNLPNAYGAHAIEHIYYNNLNKNVARKEHTDAYLSRIRDNTGVPFKRLEAKRGDTNVCEPDKMKTEGQCGGVSGLAYSLLNVLENENVTGPTIVLEDDYYLNDPNFDRLYAAMEMLPNDWDIVRFDYWGMDGKEFAATINPYVINTTTMRVTDECYGSPDTCAPYFAGGTYSMMWRGRPESVEKLKSVWSVEPYTDVDARLVMDASRFGLVTYCMNIHMGKLIEIPKDPSDIPKGW